MPELTFVLPHWLYWGGLIAFPLACMAFVWRAGGGPPASLAEESPGEPAAAAPGNALTRALDRVSLFTGAFVAYWTVIAVIVYFYEVVARYFFNSPTNWAHEAMFLMFGMQYLLSGAYAYYADAHVRVDLFYAKAAPRTKAALDVLTSFAFLIFVLALMWTAWTFFISSMDQNLVPFATGYSMEVSFTEWAIQYYPVKGMLFVGGVLLFLQGLSRVIKDVQAFRRLGDGGAEAAGDHG